MTLHRMSATLRLALRSAPLIALLAALPSHAQYKVVGPDGKVTYTDRPPPATQGKVAPLPSRGGTAASDAALPIELRQVVARYPVTLYAVTGTCELCSASRQLLRQRGIPYAEKQITGPDDSDALERVSGGRDIPTLTIGSQVLRGLSAESWNSYLDAAGYPRESKLPSSYQYAAPAPITERAAAPARAAQAAPAPATPPTAEPAADNPTGIKF
ncbi:MAG: glutaredoxin domain-containing protein [Burkholderiales bacterium]